MVNFIIGFLNVLMVLGSIFLVCIILIQRGKGGGLAGAFGGVGGSSAFGTKAGDVFTKITIGVAAGWIVAAMLLVVLTNGRRRSAFDSDTPTSVTKELGKASAKDKAAGSDLGPNDVPPPISSPTSGSPTAPVADLPNLPDIPAIAPTPAKPAPSAPAAPSTTPTAPPATATKSTPVTAPATPAPSPPTSAPAKPASTPKK